MAEQYIQGVGWVNQVVDPANPTATAARETGLSNAGPLGRGLARLFGNSRGAGRFLAGTGRGMMDVAQGGARAVTRGLEAAGAAPEGLSEAFYQSTKQNRELYQSGLGEDTAATVGRVVGQVAPAMVVPGGPAGAGLKQIAGRVGAQAGAGAGLAGLTSAPGENVAGNMLTGGLLGGGVAGALGLAAKAGRPLVNAARGRMAEGADEMVKAGERFGVKPFAADISGKPLQQKMDVAMENLPLGMTGPRMAQMKSADTAAGGIARQLGGDAEDIGKRIQSSLNNKLTERRQLASRMYEGSVMPRADALGDAAMNNAKAAAQRELGRRGTNITLDAERRKVLEQFSEIEDMPYSAMHSLRSHVGDQVRELKRTGGDRNSIRILNGLKSGIEDDMNALIGRSGNAALKRDYDAANRFYAKAVAPLQKRDLNRAAQSDNPDEVYRMFIRGQSGDRAKRFYQALDDNGRQAVRAKMFEDALSGARSYTQGRNIFSPTKFANSLDKIAASRPVFFQGAEKRDLDTFIKLMRTVKRGGEVGENPPTGARLAFIPGMGGIAGAGYAGATGDLATPAAAALGAVGSALVFRALNTSPAGKRLLAASQNPSIDSTAVQRLLAQLASSTARGAATEGGPDL